MSLLLPPTGHKARELFDVADLAAMCAPSQRAKLPGFRQALHSARATLVAAPSASAVNMVCLRADGALWLIRVTPRSWKREWSFGTL